MAIRCLAWCRIALVRCVRGMGSQLHEHRHWLGDQMPEQDASATQAVRAFLQLCCRLYAERLLVLEIPLTAEAVSEALPGTQPVNRPSLAAV